MTVQTVHLSVMLGLGLGHKAKIWSLLWPFLHLYVLVYLVCVCGVCTCVETERSIVDLFSLRQTTSDGGGYR